MFARVLLVLMLVWTFIAGAAPGKRGGWVSSGGEVFLFDRNPWFVKNVNQIRYCFVVDTTSVTTTRDEAHARFTAALDFWRDEMKVARMQATPGIVELATQPWIEEACSDDVDLKIKVGYGTLDQEEIDYLTRTESATGDIVKRVETYIGVSIRKSYDLEKMRGQGTIFIASDRGAHAYENKGQLISQAWQNPKLLQYAFMHELGHVFGVPHTGTGLMSEVFLEQALSTRLSSFYLKNPIQPFLAPPLDFEICTFSGTFNPKFFRLQEDHACLVFRKDPAPSAGPRWKVFAKKYATSTPVEIGDVNLEVSTAKTLGAKPSVTIQLPEQQQVFSVADRGFASFLIGGISKEMDYEGAFRATGSLKPYPLFASLKTDSVTFTAVVDGKPLPVLVYVPPTLMKILIGL